MNQAKTTAQPTTIAQVKALPNHAEAKSYAAANLLAIANLPLGDSPMTSKKLFMEGTSLVYEFYRLNAKHIKFYIIF